MFKSVYYIKKNFRTFTCVNTTINLNLPHNALKPFDVNFLLERFCTNSETETKDNLGNISVLST